MNLLALKCHLMLSLICRMVVILTHLRRGVIYALNLCPCSSLSMSCKHRWIWLLSSGWKIMHLINCCSAEMSSQGKAVPPTQHLAFSFCLLCYHEANMNSEDLCRTGSRRAHCQKSIIRALISCTDQGWLNSEKLRLQERKYNEKGDSLSICTWIYSNEHYLNEDISNGELLVTKAIIYNENSASSFDVPTFDCSAHILHIYLYNRSSVLWSVKLVIV
jgi:hypothetical protein